LPDSGLVIDSHNPTIAVRLKKRIEIGPLYEVENRVTKIKPALTKVHPTLLGDPNRH